MRFNEVNFPRKMRPRKDFPSNRSSELENPNRAGAFYRDENSFGKPKCNEVSVKSLLSVPTERRAQRGEERNEVSTAEFQRSPKIFCCRSFFLLTIR